MFNSMTVDFSARPDNTSDTTRRETPLHHISYQNKADGGVIFKELAFCAHLTLRGNPDNADFLAGAEKALGVALPLEALSSASIGNCHVLWITPNEWLIVATDTDPADIEMSLRAALTGHFSVVDVSGGQTLVTLSGNKVLSLLQKSCGYDVEGQFPVGKVVTTHFAKATVVLHHQAKGVYFMIVRRSFSDYAWRWLVDASAEYGLTIEGA